ncbi:MAG: hypothetical protein HDT14_04585 [Oscillibacter sp.]|nr:hypothetical protein [Oscillibacter sp.]
MSRKRLKNAMQNAALALLTLSALFLITRLSLLQNIRLSDQVQTLFPAGGGQEGGELPAGMVSSLHLMVTGGSGEYGRCGRLCAGAEDTLLQLFQEALGSAGPAGPVTDGAFQKALDGPGIYLEFSGGPLPLEIVAAWLGEETDFSQTVRAMALTAGEEEAALYLLDESGRVSLYGTSLPGSAVREKCEGFAPNGACFAYESDYRALSPYTVLTVDSALPPDIQGERPAGYSAYNLLTALDFNAHTLSRYRESGGAEVVEESPRSLRISPDGVVSFINRGEGAPALYQAAGQGLHEILAAAWRLASALTEGTGASPLYLCGAEVGENGCTLLFRYQVEGVPVFFSGEEDALTITFQEGNITAFTYRCRVYTALEEDTAELPGPLPAAMAQAIAAGYPGSRLMMGYVDDGSGQVAAQWLRED